MKFLIVFLSLIGLLFSQEDGYVIKLKARADESRLSNGYEPWKSNTVGINIDKKNSYGIGLKEESLKRYGIEDDVYDFSAWLKAADGMVFSGSFSAAGDGMIVPEKSVYIGFSYAIAKRWLLEAGRKGNEYNTGSESEITSAGIVTYQGDYRLSYTRYSALVKDAGASGSDKISIHLFYGDNGFIAFLHSRGKELEVLSYGAILAMDVTTYAIFGEHIFKNGFGVEYSYEYSEQGDLYTREGIGIGAVYRF